MNEKKIGKRKRELIFIGSLILLFLFGALTQASQASSVGATVFPTQNHIDIISQTGVIDANLTYTFTELNNTHWRANFCVNPSATQTVFNASNYPLANLTSGISFEQVSPIRFNGISKCGWFYIIFPQGFKPNLKAKFGTNSTLISTSTTTAFVSNYRSICRDSSNEIHVAYLYNATDLIYANSTNNGVSFTTRILNNSAGFTRNIPYITCSGSTVLIASIFYNTSASANNGIAVYKSTDNGATWAYTQPRTNKVRPQTAGGMATIELINTNAYVVYQQITTTNAYDDINFFSSTDTGSTWGNDISVFHGSYISGKFGCTETYILQATAVNGSGGASDKIFVMAAYTFHGQECGDGELNEMKNSSDSGTTWSSYYTMASSIYRPSLTAWGNSLWYTTVTGSGNDVLAYNQTTTFNYNTFTSTKLNYDLNSTWYNISAYPTVGVNNSNAIVIYSQKEYKAAAYENNYKLVSSNWSSASGWSALSYNLTTNSTDNIYPILKATDTGGCQEYVYMNGTASPYGIVYGAIGTCPAYIPPVSGGGTPPVMDVGDPLYCSIPPFIPSVQSIGIMCMPKSNTTGQPLTGLTVTCGAYSSPIFGAVSQAASSATAQANGLYNWTFLAANQAANTCYIINCSTTINGVTNIFAGTTCVMQNNLVTSTDVTNIINNITAAQNNILGNMSSNFTNTNNLITYIMAQFLTLQNDIISVNQTCIGISNDLAAARAVLNSMATNLTGMNTTFLAQFGNISSQLYDLNITLTGISANITQVQISLTDINTSMADNFTNVISQLAIIEADVAHLNISIGNLTTNQIATAVWAYSHKTLTPLNTTVLTLTSTPGWQLPKGYAPKMSCSSNQNESNITLYFAGTAVPNPYTYAPSQGTYEVRCESPASENYSAGTSVAYLVITMGGTGGSTGNATNDNNSISPLISATEEQLAPTGWIEYIFIVIPTTAYRILQITLFGLGLWAYFLAGLVVIFLLSIASKREIKSLTDVPFYGMVALIFAIIIFIVYILVPLAIR